MGEDLQDSRTTSKKGTWIAEEDEILRAYVSEHGEKNWNGVAKKTGLSRSGKSCRLRWLNHLKPTLKKGPFSKKEEDDVVRLHAQYGNQWARMATQIPGRTDNDIKNYWNTREKRLKRNVLPIYPPEVQMQAAAPQTGQNTYSMDAYQNFFQPSNRFRETQAAIPFMGGYATNAQSYQIRRKLLIGSTSYKSSVPPCSRFLDDASYGSTSQPVIRENEILRLPSLQPYPPEVQAQAAATQTPLNAHQNFFQPPNIFQRQILSMQDMNIHYRKRKREMEAAGLFIAGMNMNLQKRLRETEAASPFMGGYATNAQSYQLQKKPFIGSTSSNLSIPPCSHFVGDATYGSTSRLPALQSWDFQEESCYRGPRQSDPMPILDPGNNFVQTNHAQANRGKQQCDAVSELGLDNTLVQTPMRDQAASLNPVSELEPDNTCLQFPLLTLNESLMLESLDLDFPLDDTILGHDFGMESDSDVDGMPNNTFVQAPVTVHEPSYCRTQQYTTRSGIQFPLEEQTTSEFMSTLDDQLLKPFDKQFPLDHFEDTPVDTKTLGHDFSTDTDFDLEGMPK